MNYEKGRRTPGRARLTGDEQFTATDTYAGKPVTVLINEVEIFGFDYLTGDPVRFSYVGAGTQVRADGTPGVRKVTAVNLRPDDVPEAVRVYLHERDVEDAARAMQIADERQRLGFGRVAVVTTPTT